MAYLALALVLLLLLVKAWRLAETAFALRSNARELVMLVETAADHPSKLAEAATILSRARANVATLRNESAPLLPLASALGWLPVYGPDLAAAAPLLDAADALAAAGDAAGEPLATAAPLLVSDDLPLTETVQQLAAARLEIATMRAEMSRARAALDAVDADRLSPELGPRVAQLQALLPAAEAGLELALAGGEAAAAIEPLLPLTEGADVPATRVAQVLAAARPQLAAARTALDQARLALARVPPDAIPPQLAGRIVELREIEPAAGVALELALAAGDAAAAVEPMLPLLAAENPAPTDLLAQLAAARPALNQARQASARALLAADRLPPSDHAAVAALPSAAALLDAMIQLAAGGGETAAALAPITSGSGRNTAWIVSQLAAARPGLEQARLRLAGAAQSRARVAEGQLPELLLPRLAQLDSALPRARDGVDMLLALPGMLGTHGPRTYLIVAQNPDELRATGGFLTAAGLLTVDDGDVTEMSLRDSGLLDDFANKPYPIPPPPLTRYLGTGLWTLRDANWSPDFPTSATAIRTLFELGQEQSAEDVVAFDVHAIARILEKTGPVRVNGALVGAETVIDFVRAERSADDAHRQRGRKLFLDELARALIARVKALPPEQLLDVARAVWAALDERHMVVALTDPAEAELARRMGWDGTLSYPGGDYLLVIDSNVGATKSDANITRAITYSVDLSRPDSPTAELTLAYRHRGAATPCVPLAPIEPAQPFYEQMMARCYWNYARALVPPGSVLTSWTNTPTPASWTVNETGDSGRPAVAIGEGGMQQLSAFVVVPAGEARVIIFRYHLPAQVVERTGAQHRYRLSIRKQPGTTNVPVTIRVRLPARARVTGDVPPGLAHEGQDAVVTRTLTRDQVVAFEFSVGAAAQTSSHTKEN
jgi:hypothetical protein